MKTFQSHCVSVQTRLTCVSLVNDFLFEWIMFINLHINKGTLFVLDVHRFVKANANHFNSDFMSLLLICVIFLCDVDRKPVVEPENHASPLSDASKKRLIEDTEDWHPRTGTSQSRSFRILAQLTGTENGTSIRFFVAVFTFVSVSFLQLFTCD